MVSCQRGTLKTQVIGLSRYSLVPWLLLSIEKISLLLQTASYLEIRNLLELCASRVKFYSLLELLEVCVQGCTQHQQCHPAALQKRDAES